MFSDLTSPPRRASLSLPYYFEEIDRLFSPGFMPSEQDVVRSRAKTLGITETAFRIGDLVRDPLLRVCKKR